MKISLPTPQGLNPLRVATDYPPPPSQGFEPLPTEMVPLCTILGYSYLVTDPKNFLRAPKGRVRAEKTRFFNQSFPKSA